MAQGLSHCVKEAGVVGEGAQFVPNLSLFIAIWSGFGHISLLIGNHNRYTLAHRKTEFVSSKRKGLAMTSRIGWTLSRVLAGAVAAAGLGLYAGGAMAATSLGVFDNWTAWTDNDGSGKICYISATPQRSEPTNVNRGAIHFLVTIRPTNRNEVATIVGYPIHETNPNASASVDGRSYPMVTQGESAWLASIEDEPGFVGAMRAGATLVVRATSQRGTNTVDTYSLVGVTAALNRAAEECPQ